MKVQKQVKWLVPYLMSVKHIVPIHRIVALKGYKVPKHLEEQAYGNCLKDHKGRFTISMRLYRWDKKSKEYLSLYIGHLLETFAHELAHTCKNCHNHSPLHMKYTGIILARFEKVLKKQGIKDTYKTRMKYE